ncbi:FadR/GntR family transcriptional regulator [Cryptosporangium aurantiacum]|uniref:Transcriptional regulator, GntR family n=1 Tax=Cryptosporangium aurantiacum TaxID=134849 RepID=A0A1M7PJY0_9ACTN|nr:FCD domain-containing protein [Cryptosporangium aurantiacum]SHN17231.1 transcriptional regulator, GntR family [Cryptosporangium aurantiacum]
MVTTSEPVGRGMRAAKTGELIASYLRGRIVRGELVEGDSLPSEADLMDQFEVSRPTLREAFRILEAESLIAIRRGSRGARIVAPSVDVAARYVGLLLQHSKTTLADVYEARSVIETAAAAMLAERRTAQDVADLRECVAGLENLVESGDPSVDAPVWSTATTTFHELVLERSRNQTLALQSAVLREIIAMHLAIVARRSTDPARNLREFRKSVRSSRKLVDLVEAKDAEGAEKHWRAHMEAAARSLLRDDLRSATVLDLFN